MSDEFDAEKTIHAFQFIVHSSQLINMLYMVIEHYNEGAGPAIYKRFRENGRMMPDGLNYVASWIEPDFSRCFQVMSWDDPAVFDEWTAKWSDLMTFEAVPVITSADAQEIMRNR